MTFLSWRRDLVLAAIDRALDAGPGCAADPLAEASGGASASAATQAWDRLHRDLAGSLPPQEIRAALDELVSSRRHHCQAHQLVLIELLRQQACAEGAPAQAKACDDQRD